MVSLPPKSLVDRLMELQGDCKVPLSQNNVFKPCFEASMEELVIARYSFVNYIIGLWKEAQASCEPRMIFQLGQMAIRAGSILDSLTFISGIRNGNKGVSCVDIDHSGNPVKARVIGDPKLPEIPGSHSNLDGYPVE